MAKKLASESLPNLLNCDFKFFFFALSKHDANTTSGLCSNL
jgi:hypothetical protein